MVFIKLSTFFAPATTTDNYFLDKKGEDAYDCKDVCAFFGDYVH